MKKLMMLAAAILFSALLTLPVLAASQEPKGSTQRPTQAQAVDKGKAVDESEGRKLHKAYFQKRAEMLQRRDAALEVRMQNISSDSPGNTGR